MLTVHVDDDHGLLPVVEVLHVVVLLPEESAKAQDGITSSRMRDRRSITGNDSSSNDDSDAIIIYLSHWYGSVAALLVVLSYGHVVSLRLSDIECQALFYYSRPTRSTT